MLVYISYRRRNEIVRSRIGPRKNTSGRVDWKALKGFGHVKRISGERFTKRIKFSGVRKKG